MERGDGLEGVVASGGIFVDTDVDSSLPFSSSVSLSKH